MGIDKRSNWLTLTGASELLGVHPSTLRTWADAGLVRAFLTPGGHRRFLASELAAFIEQRRSDAPSNALVVSREHTLQQVRQQLGERPVAREPWFRRLSDAERAQHRATGERLLGLLLQFVSREENADHFLVQARGLARDYGSEFAQAGASIVELAQAFLLFRRMIVYAVYHPANSLDPNDAESVRLWQRINLFMDELLIATLESFQKGIEAGPAKHLTAQSRTVHKPAKHARRTTR